MYVPGMSQRYLCTFPDHIDISVFLTILEDYLVKRLGSPSDAREILEVQEGQNLLETVFIFVSKKGLYEHSAEGVWVTTLSVQ
mmetsp:Transcript_1126/g.2249  ORF Transcript_1126/g.2249 Transcript_1126/m.2249 type:complete len:83 (-) Transcript_1126:197-445(-)